MSPGERERVVQELMDHSIDWSERTMVSIRDALCRAYDAGASRLAEVEAALEYVNAVARGEVDEEPCKPDCNFNRFCGERCSRHCSRRPVGLLLRRIHDLEDQLRAALSEVKP